MTIQEMYTSFVRQLKTIYNERESNNITDWVFESVAKIKRIDRIINKQTAISKGTTQQLNTVLQQLLQHTPVQYVLEEAWFFKMKLKVNQHVLIPRPETEELVEWAVQEFRIQNSEFRIEKLTILDIGTGSGCIALAIKKELPNVEVYAIDVSESALAVANKNATDQNVEIKFIQIDFLNESLWSPLPTLNLIVSNPPYIPGDEKTKMAKNVVDHEPHLALFVEDNDPFIFYKKIATFAEKHLQPQGKIFVEVHENFSKEVSDIFLGYAFKVEIKKDIYGRERMVKAYR